MIYGSVCSGIEAASVAWEPLGWRAAFLSEIEAAPRAILSHHYPDVPLHGDFTTIRAGDYADIDVLVGGTPCQDFSVAGQRGGLDGERGGLTLAYADLAYELGPGWLVWENVPGVFSNNEGRDFGAVLACFAGHPAGTLFQPPPGGWRNAGIVPPAGPECYGLAWRTLDAQYVRVDGFPRAVPQRRRRVFVVGYLGDWRPAAAVLLERAGLSGNPAPRREARAGIAVGALAGTGPGGGWRIGPDEAAGGQLVAQVASTLPAGGNGTGGDRQPGTSAETAGSMLVAFQCHGSNVGPAGTLRGGNGHVGSVPCIAFNARQDPDVTGEIAGALNTSSPQDQAIAFDTTQITSKENRSRPEPGDPCHPLAAEGHPPAIAWSIMPQNSSRDFKARQVDVAQPLMAGGPVGGNQGGDYIQQAWAVRRLLPIECERLQGFPDGWTDVPAPGRNSSLADGPRYKALGNSMAVPVMRWIGQRIAHVDALLASRSFLSAAE